MKVVERNHARSLRKAGKSINEIIAETGYSKGSVSVWVRDIVLTKKQKERLSENGRSMESVERRRLSRMTNQENKTKIIMDVAKKDFSAISLRDLKIIGVMLYLGEGGKTKRGMVRLANSDPAITQMCMRFFREVCSVPEEKFYGHIHTFDNADIEKTEAYWSRITRIPRKQFYKTYVKQSKASLGKRKTLPYGTCDVGINDVQLYLKIMAWIEKIKELVLQ